MLKLPLQCSLAVNLHLKFLHLWNEENINNFLFCFFIPTFKKKKKPTPKLSGLKNYSWLYFTVWDRSSRSTQLGYSSAPGGISWGQAVVFSRCLIQDGFTHMPDTLGKCLESWAQWKWLESWALPLMRSQGLSTWSSQQEVVRHAQWLGILWQRQKPLILSLKLAQCHFCHILLVKAVIDQLASRGEMTDFTSQRDKCPRIWNHF